MRNILLSLSILIGSTSFSGGFRWPNVEYKSAKVFLYNIDLEKESLFDWFIYENGVYANSKLGEGFDASEKFLDELHASLARGVNELRMGLSKCYMPRHGIIYYDENYKPVASFSLCFECDKISFWSTNELPHADWENPHNDWDRAEKQIEKIESIFKKYKFPVFDRPEGYKSFVEENERFSNLGEMFITDPNLDSLYFKHYSIEEVNSWLLESRRGIKLIQKEETKISAGGEKWTYQTLSDRDNLTNFVFSFDENDPFLVEANIEHSNIILPNGISVGMSIDDVQAKFMVYDGIAWPEHIQVKDKKLQLDYYFKNRTLVKIKASFSIT